MSNTKIIEDYFQELNKVYVDDDAREREHSYRTALENLLNKLIENNFSDEVNDYKIFQESRTASKGQEPDFSLKKNGNLIGIIEHKTVREQETLMDAMQKNNKQFDRYLTNFDNFISTDGIRFYLYLNNDKNAVKSVNIGELKTNIITGESNWAYCGNETEFMDLLKKFCQGEVQGITNQDKFVEKIASIAREIYTIVFEEKNVNSELKGLHKFLKKELISSMNDEDFADMYAQVLVHGLLNIRLINKNEENFDLLKARILAEDINDGLLKQLLDKTLRIKKLRIVLDDYCELLKNSDMDKVVNLHGNPTQDPMLHFYENFLEDYDNNKRKSLGVFYTPLPAANCIVRNVDKILKKKLDFQDGFMTENKPLRIIDPATGTGTFFNQIIEYVYDEILKNDTTWDIKNIFNKLSGKMVGFEIMIASYIIAQMKLTFAIQNKLNILKNDKNFSSVNIDKNVKIPEILLTNSLENQDHNEKEGLFGLQGEIVKQAQKANTVKNLKDNDMTSIILGNPPYNDKSTNNSEYALGLIKEFKIEPGTNDGLNETSMGSLNDDYLKFIGLSKDFIKNTKQGINAFVIANGFLDSITFRGVRYDLLSFYDELYIINLHGNSRKKETSPNGSKDENIFNIQSGVCILVAVKFNKEKTSDNLAKVYVKDVYGTKEHKFEILDNTNILDEIESGRFKEIELNSPNYFFTTTEYDDSYNNFISVKDLFKENSGGILTLNESIVIDFNKDKLSNKIKKLYNKNISTDKIRETMFFGRKLKNYPLGDTRDFKLDKVRSLLDFNKEKIVDYSYRVFDKRYVYLEDMGFIRTGSVLAKKIIKKENLIMVTSRICNNKEFFDQISTVTKDIIDTHFSSVSDFLFPLYLYTEPDVNSLFADEENTEPVKTTNFNEKVKKELLINLSNKFIEKMTPEDLFYYVYGRLNNPKFIEKFRNELKIDFPKIPQPESEEIFTEFSIIGEKLANLHLLKNINENNDENRNIAKIENTNITNLIVNKVKFKLNKDEDKTLLDELLEDNVEDGNNMGKIYFGTDLVFSNIPENVWSYVIGSLKPLQNYLKTRKGRKLDSEEIVNIRQMVISLSKTIELQEELRLINTEF